MTNQTAVTWSSYPKDVIISELDRMTKLVETLRLALSRQREVNETLMKALTEARITLHVVTSNPITAYELGMARRALTQADAALAAARAPKEGLALFREEVGTAFPETVKP